MRPIDRSDADRTTSNLSANPGYAFGQLARALEASASHPDPAVRTRAARKVASWTQVLEGMRSGNLRVGDRTPVAGTPAWATLEVAHGGFATGNLLAAGELQPHERERLQRLPPAAPGRERAAINASYLTDDGLQELQQLVADGRYRVQVPEEGALLVLAWLLRRGDIAPARALLEEIGPWLERLRFYPVPAERAASTSSLVHLQDVGTTLRQLAAVRPEPRVEQMKEAIRVWAPLYERVVALFLETVRGEPPSLRRGPDGKPLLKAGRCETEGGWPCQVYPEGWRQRAEAVLADYARLREEHRLCATPDAAHGGFATLRRYLERCLRAPAQLTGREVAIIRSILAGVAATRGLPGSARHAALRAHQARQVAGPDRAEQAQVLSQRLHGLPPDEGLPTLDGILDPISQAEAERLRVPAGKPILASLARKVRRSLDAPLRVLVDDQIIPSSEVLARVLPQLTAQVRAAGINDPDLRRLYGAIYAAFRRRRSLLLLNLQSQVKLEELPWVQAIQAYRTAGGAAAQQARQVLEELATTALTGFPQQILPNKLLQEIRALADSADLKLRLPVVDEVAADIFMGTFSEKYLRAAQQAARLLHGSLYERYYGLPYGRVGQLNDVTKAWFGAPTSPGFAALCVELAVTGGTAHRGRSVAYNGTIIEQEQVLTTHNLAGLFEVLGLAASLHGDLADLAQRNFAWICRRLQQRTTAWKPRLRAVKNCAYAWRQLVFFLSVAPRGAAEAFLPHAEAWLGQQPEAFQSRFRPALVGLANAVQGRPLEQDGGRRFLGWSTGKHWLLADAAPAE